MEYGETAFLKHLKSSRYFEWNIVREELIFYYA